MFVKGKEKIINKHIDKKYIFKISIILLKNNNYFFCKLV